jgi:hypothetical protein
LTPGGTWWGFEFLPQKNAWNTAPIALGARALQNAARVAQEGILSPSIFRIPRSGLSFRQSCGDYGTVRNGQKTYGSVFGMIFLGGAGAALVARKQRVATEKIPKNWKNAKKSAK